MSLYFYTHPTDNPKYGQLHLRGETRGSTFFLNWSWQTIFFFFLYLIKIKTSFICGKYRLGSSCPSLIFIHHWRPTFTCFIKGSCRTKNKPLTFQLKTKPIFWQILNNLKWKHTCILITPAFIMGLLEKSGSGLPVLTPSHTRMLMSFSST